RQGDYDAETVYGQDPLAVAQQFAAAGARWIHVVDLDAARTGDPVNRSAIADIARVVGGRAAVQSGGGVRTLDDVRDLAACGIARVVMGSAAVAEPSLVEEASMIVDVAVGLDHRQGELAVHGWTQGSGVDVMDALDWFPTAAAFVVTDIARDGMLLGPDLEGLRRCVEATSIPIVASGGVASLDDVRALARIGGLTGIITGKALYEGRIVLGDALRAVAEETNQP
ncbi:MAG: HisA/HisF-related TIM barrel protein, partial [Actinomycetota bacterium]